MNTLIYYVSDLNELVEFYLKNCGMWTPICFIKEHEEFLEDIANEKYLVKCLVEPVCMVNLNKCARDGDHTTSASSWAKINCESWKL